MKILKIIAVIWLVAAPVASCEDVSFVCSILKNQVEIVVLRQGVTEKNKSTSSTKFSFKKSDKDSSVLVMQSGGKIWVSTDLDGINVIAVSSGQTTNYTEETIPRSFEIPNAFQKKIVSEK